MINNNDSQKISSPKKDDDKKLVTSVSRESFTDRTSQNSDNTSRPSSEKSSNNTNNTTEVKESEKKEGIFSFFSFISYFGKIWSWLNLKKITSTIIFFNSNFNSYFYCILISNFKFPYLFVLDKKVVVEGEVKASTEKPSNEIPLIPTIPTTSSSPSSPSTTTKKDKGDTSDKKKDKTGLSSNERKRQAIDEKADGMNQWIDKKR